MHRLFYAIFILYSCSSMSAPLLCREALEAQEQTTTIPGYPREIDPKRTFDALVDWYREEIIIKRNAPGLLLGISGTDSIVAFLAAAKAFEQVGKPERVAGIHIAPSEEFLEDNPNASSHLWFQEKVIPWLRTQAPKALIAVDTSVDFRIDGLRWGVLMERSTTEYPTSRTMRPPRDQYWLVGTRNATEEALFTYSNSSTIASVQPLIHLWKSEILALSKYLGVPQEALQKSCEVDCVCGRLSLPAYYIPELDAMLMARKNLLSQDYLRNNIPPTLFKQLNSFITQQTSSANFKEKIPYQPEKSAFHSQNSLDEETLRSIKKRIDEGS